MKKILAAPNLILVLIFAVYFVIAGANAATWLPMCDEVWFANPAINLMNRGFFGTTVLEETANFRNVRLDGINEKTYWILPLFPLSQIVWYKIFGVGLLQLRFFVILWGAINLAAWFLLIKKIADEKTALLTAALLAVDFVFIGTVAIGRMDMMTAALGTSALAIYFWRREANFHAAVFGAACCSAAAMMTHPLGLLSAVSLTILALWLDWRKINFKTFLLAGLPPFVFFGLWAIYIFQDFETFRIQFGGNASDRWAFFQAPLTEIWREISIRYLASFGIGENLSAFGQIKIFLLLVFCAAILANLLSPRLRQTFASRVLLVVAAQQAAMLLLLDSLKQHFYLIYTIPIFIALCAVWLNHLRRANKFYSVGVIAVIVVFAAINLSISAARVRRDAYHRQFLPAAQFLNQNAAPDDLIMASAEFYFALERPENLTDDYRWGFRTRKKARFIVLEEQRYTNWFNNLQKSDAENFAYSSDLLNQECEIAFENEIYQIYRRR